MNLLFFSLYLIWICLDDKFHLFLKTCVCFTLYLSHLCHDFMSNITSIDVSKLVSSRYLYWLTLTLLYSVCFFSEHLLFSTNAQRSIFVLWMTGHVKCFEVFIEADSHLVVNEWKIAGSRNLIHTSFQPLRIQVCQNWTWTPASMKYVCACVKENETGTERPALHVCVRAGDRSGWKSRLSAPINGVKGRSSGLGDVWFLWAGKWTV